jgi:hypothetical protein
MTPVPLTPFATLSRLAVSLFAICCLARAAFAHNAPGSSLLLDFHSDRLGAELRLPLSELEIAFREPLEAQPATVVARFGDRLADYVRQHLQLTAPDDRAWSVAVSGQRVALGESPIDLVVALELRPPDGAPLRRFTLRCDAVSHEVMNHIILVSVRSDWNQALLGTRPELLGALRSFARELPVDRAAGSAWIGFRSLLTLGMRHIAEGTDHLMFLLVLLLPAPLLATGKRWGSHGGLRHSATSLAKIVTAFTIGHSLTLIIGALGWLRLPGPLVEMLIAVSILVSAIHSVRPSFAGREPLVALGFGLVHGLAFASVLAEFSLDAWHLAAALLAFNVGIELMQLGVVILTVPWLVLLSRTRLYTLIRIGGAVFAGVAAVGWIAERAGGWPNPLNAVVESIAAHTLWWVTGLALLALLTTFWTQPAAASGPDSSSA